MRLAVTVVALQAANVVLAGPFAQEHGHQAVKHVHRVERGQRNALNAVNLISARTPALGIEDPLLESDNDAGSASIATDAIDLIARSATDGRITMTAHTDGSYQGTSAIQQTVVRTVTTTRTNQVTSNGKTSAAITVSTTLQTDYTTSYMTVVLKNLAVSTGLTSSACGSNSPALTGTLAIISSSTATTSKTPSQTTSKTTSKITSSSAAKAASSTSKSTTASALVNFTTKSPTTTSVHTSTTSSKASSKTTSSTKSTVATVAAPAPTQSGIVSGCTEWYVAQSGDYCYLVANKFGISVDTFMAWNPAVNPPSCNTMYAGDAYCVAIDGTSAATSAASTKVVTTTTAAASSAASTNAYAYKMYTGNGTVAAGWPSMSQWLDFETMFTYNEAIMQSSCASWSVADDSATEIANIKAAIVSLASANSIDPRFILAIIMQESGGCVRVITTSWSVDNPGLMQSHDGTGSCNRNSVVQNPCPQSEIYQMIEDGTQGTSSGDGLKQCLTETGVTDVSMYYRAARIYNGGSGGYNPDNLGAGCCTLCYSSDVANRLTGWHTGVSTCTL